MTLLKLEQHRFGKTSKHLSLRFLHLGNFHHAPTNISTELNNSSLQHMDAASSDFGIKVLGIPTIDHQAGFLKPVLIDLQGTRHAGHPHNDICFRDRFIEGQDASTPQFLL